jgi:hypothetical protein
MSNTHLEEDRDAPLSWAVVVQRIAMGAAAALVVGAGSMVISNNTKVSLHDQQINRMEVVLDTLPSIDKNLAVLAGKVDVLNQKLDDAQAYRQANQARAIRNENWNEANRAVSK